jgi:hypothetical protein
MEKCFLRVPVLIHGDLIRYKKKSQMKQMFVNAGLRVAAVYLTLFSLSISISVCVCLSVSALGSEG